MLNIAQYLGKIKDRTQGALKSPLVWRAFFTTLFLCVSQAAFADFNMEAKMEKATKFLLSPWGDNSPWIMIVAIISLAVGVRYYKGGKWGKGTFFVALAVGLIYAPDAIYDWMPERMKPGIDKIISLKPPEKS